MVGMGLDTGHLVYVRAQGQAAVDAAALAAASAIPTGSATEVNDRAEAFNSENNYADSSNNLITDKNITYVQYNPTDGSIATSGVSIANANGVRVALETTNPHTGASPATAMISRVFLMPLLNLFGHNIDDTARLNVSAVAVIKAAPGLPIAIQEASVRSLIRKNFFNRAVRMTTQVIQPIGSITRARQRLEIIKKR